MWQKSHVAGELDLAADGTVHFGFEAGPTPAEEFPVMGEEVGERARVAEVNPACGAFVRLRGAAPGWWARCAGRGSPLKVGGLVLLTRKEVPVLIQPLLLLFRLTRGGWPRLLAPPLLMHLLRHPSYPQPSLSHCLLGHPPPNHCSAPLTTTPTFHRLESPRFASFGKDALLCPN